MPPIIRAEGLTELVGDIILVCSGGTPTASGGSLPTTNFSILLNTPVTSRVLAGSLTEALLLIDETGLTTNPTQLVCGTGATIETPVGSGVCTGITGTGNGIGAYSGVGARANIFQGRLAGPAMLMWSGVPFDPPGPNKTRTLRFTNLRVNASAATGATARTGIQASISVSSATAITINSATTPVAFVQSGLAFSIRTADNSAAMSYPVYVPNCNPGPTRIATLRFSETFPTGFRPRTGASFVDANTSPAPANQNIPGQVYASESGFRNGAFGSDSLHGNLATAGLADYGTRLRAQFSIQPGVTIWVEPVNLGSSATATARLVTAETSAFSPSSPPTPVNPLVPLSNSNGSATAVWEILGANPNMVDTFDFGVYVSYSGGAPGSTASVTVRGNLAAVGPSPPSGSIPQFIDVSSSVSLFILATGSCGSLTASPTSLSFSYQSGAAIGTSQTLALTLSSGYYYSSATAFSYTSAGGNWLAATPNSTLTPGNITVSANPIGLGPGTYTGTILISSPNAGNAVLVPVNMVIQAPALILPSKATFYFQPGQTPPPQKISVTSRDGSPMLFTTSVRTITPQGVAWLSATQSKPVTPANITLTMNPAGLGAGSFVSIVNVVPLRQFVGMARTPSLLSDNSCPAVIEDGFTTYVDAVNSAPSPFMMFPPSIAFTDTDHSPHSIVVFDTGMVNFSTFPVSSGWLCSTPSGGTTGTPNATITASTTSTANLAPNPAYGGWIAIQDFANSVNGRAVDVTLAVNGAAPELSVMQDSIQSCYSPGSAPPGPFSIDVSSSMGSNLNYTTAVTNHSPWLSATGGAGGSTSFITIDPTKPTKLVPGDYDDSVQYIATGASNQPGVAVHLTVSSACGATASTSSLPHFAAGGGFVTDLYVANLSTATANFSINFFDDNGSPIPSTPSLAGSVPGQGVKFYELGTPQAPLQAGSAVITGDPSITVQALFRRLGQDNKYYEAAVPVSTGTREFWMPFDDTTLAANGAQIFTGIAIANLDPSNNPANVVCAAQDNLGNPIPNAVKVPRLNPNGHWANYLFPALTGELGILHCTSDVNIGAMGIRALGDNAISSLPVITQPVSSSSTSLLPHFAAGGGFVTDLYAINSSAPGASFNIGFFNDGGTPSSLANIKGMVPANGVNFYELGSYGSTLQAGSALISGPIGVQALFRRLVDNNSYYEAAVQTTAGVTDFWIPFDATTFSATGEQIYTGIAVANLDPHDTATLACTVHDTQGKMIPNAMVGPPAPLQSMGHWANYLFPALVGNRGLIHCTSNTLIGATGIRALGTNAISTLPVIVTIPH